MNSLVALPVILPLLGAALGVIAAPYRWVQRALALTALAANVVISILLFIAGTYVTIRIQ